MTNTDLHQLQHHLGYHFTTLPLLETALTHRSYLNEAKVNQSNERLEYLGDAVLELVISDYLYHQLPDDPEGILTTARAAVVRTESLAQAATTLTLGDFLKMSRGEEKTGGRANLSLLANTFEAVLGAVYLDGGFEKAAAFVQSHLIPQAKSTLEGDLKDAKSLLQEKVQELGYHSPAYVTLQESGPDHDKHFIIAVMVGDRELAKGEGKNKQSAQQAAARAALDHLPPEAV